MSRPKIDLNLLDNKFESRFEEDNLDEVESQPSQAFDLNLLGELPQISPWEMEMSDHFASDILAEIMERRLKSGIMTGDDQQFHDDDGEHEPPLLMSMINQNPYDPHQCLVDSDSSDEFGNDDDDNDNNMEEKEKTNNDSSFQEVDEELSQNSKEEEDRRRKTKSFFPPVAESLNNYNRPSKPTMPTRTATKSTKSKTLIRKKPTVKFYRLSSLNFEDKIVKNQILDTYLYAPVTRVTASKLMKNRTQIFKVDPVTGELMKVSRIEQHSPIWLPCDRLVSEVSVEDFQFNFIPSIITRTSEKEVNKKKMMDAGVQFPPTPATGWSRTKNSCDVDAIFVNHVHKLCPQFSPKMSQKSKKGRPPHPTKSEQSRSGSTMIRNGHRLVAISRHEIVSTVVDKTSKSCDCFVKPLIHSGQQKDGGHTSLWLAQEKKEEKNFLTPQKARHTTTTTKENEDGSKGDKGGAAAAVIEKEKIDNNKLDSCDEPIILIKSSDELTFHLKKFSERVTHIGDTIMSTFSKAKDQVHPFKRKEKHYLTGGRRKRSQKRRSTMSPPPPSGRSGPRNRSIPSRSDIARSLQERIELQPGFSMSKLLTLSPLQRLKYLRNSYSPSPPSSSPSSRIVTNTGQHEEPQEEEDKSHDPVQNERNLIDPTSVDN